MQWDFTITDIARIIYVGAEEYPEPCTVFSPRLGTHELIYNFGDDPTAVWGEVILGENSVPLVPRSIRFMPAGEWSKYEVRRQNKGYGCIDIVFSSDTPPAEELTLLTDIRNSRIEELFRRAFSIWAVQGEGYRFECMSVLYRIFAELQKEQYLPERQYALIRPAVDRMAAAFRDPDLSCEQLADLCGISYSYFRQLFLARFHVPPKQYLLQMRVRYACDLLCTTLLPVSRIAEMAGFSDLFYFCRRFKTAVGVTPTDFRRRYRSSK